MFNARAALTNYIRKTPMPSDEAHVLTILIERLTTMGRSLKKDTPKNYQKKSHNFLLSALPQERVLEMVFTSSLESKLGNAMENSAKDIARVRFGEEAIPQIYLGEGSQEQDKPDYLASMAGRRLGKNQQIILTRRNQEQIEAHAATVRNRYQRKRGGIGQGISQHILREEIVGAEYDMTEHVTSIAVDLLIYLPARMTMCMEIKAGGDLDSTKAKEETLKLLTLCAAANATHGYFATLYNKSGEGKGFSGAMTSYLAPDMMKSGSEFWGSILPDTMSYDDFQKLYKQAFQASRLFDIIEELTQDLLKVSKAEAVETAEEVLGAIEKM